MRYSGAVMTGEGLRHNIERGAPVRKPRSTSTARLAAAMLVLAAVLPLVSAWSQGGSVFRGQVVADSSFAPLPGAQVTLMELERSVDAGPDGEFRFADLAAGTITVRIRFVGYAPQSVRVRVDGRDSLVRDFLLVRVAPVLANVAVTAKADAPVPVQLMEFERRRLRGEGRFITPEQMARERGRKTSEVLRKIPGIYLYRLPNGVQAVGSSRGTMSIARTPQGRCYATVVLDGVVVSTD